MASFSTSLRVKDGPVRPIVPVLIADASEIPTHNEESSSQNIPPVTVKLTKFKWLIDTGATMTCVTRELAEKLKLKPLGTRPVSSASESKVDKNIYRLMIIIAVEGKVPEEIKSESISYAS